MIQASNPLRILLVLPMYGGSLPIGNYCAAALRDLGHHVEVFDAPAYLQTFESLRSLGVAMERKEQLETGLLHLLGQAIHAIAERFEPDLVLAMAQAPLGRSTLQRLRRDGIPTAMWFVEDFRLFTYWKAFAPFYDAFFVIQKEPFLSELKAIGVENAYYLPLAALPTFHKPLKLSAAEQQYYGSQISFMGAGYPNRRQAFRQLLPFDFKIWGSDWNGDQLLKPYVQQEGQRITPEESIKIFNATTINLNLHSSIKSTQLVSQGDFVNPRTFELASCGAFQLVDQRGLLSELFNTEGSEAELVVFTTMPELLETIDYYLAHPKERFSLGLRARARILHDHTYHIRMNTLLEYIQKSRIKTNQPWPLLRKHTELPNELPEPLRHELATLLQRLRLPKNAPFEDVLTRLRSESGELSGLETALLFLDEWKKQYMKSK